MNLPTVLSLARIALAFLLFIESTPVRICAILLAALTDFLDGFLARRLNQVSQLGTIIDPLADKFFVGIALFLFWHEERLELYHVAIFLLRDLSLLIFSGYLWITNSLRSWQVRSFLSGKLATTIQFLALLFLALNVPVPLFLWICLVITGISSLFELLLLRTRETRSL